MKTAGLNLKCSVNTYIFPYWLNESRNLKIHAQYLKSGIFDKVHLKVVSFDKNLLLRGWKLLEFKWEKTAFGEPNNKGLQMISTPTKVLGTPFLIYFLSVTQGEGRP